MSVDKPKQWDLKRTRRAHKSLSHGEPIVRQSLRLGSRNDWRQLQSNTIWVFDKIFSLDQIGSDKSMGEPL